MTRQDEDLTAVATLLGAEASHRAVLAAADRLGAVLGGTVRVWLADYRQTRLVALTDETAPESEPEHVPVDNSPAGRCYAAQEASREGAERLFVPLAHQGHRLGVCEVAAPAPLDAEQAALVESVAPLLAQAVTSLGRMTDVYEVHRRAKVMTVAAELQWELLPGHSYGDADVTVAGTLEPAYSIAGDVYDWCRDGDQLHLLVADGTGRGVPAALTTTLALSAWRNARRAGLDLRDQAALTDQAVYAHHAGEAFVSALLMRLDLKTGDLAVVDAGSPLLYRLRDGGTELVELEAQLPLGMFEESVYDEQRVELRPGDRLVVVSDGIHASRTGHGQDFGAWRLERTLRETRNLPAGEAARQLMRALHEELPSSDDPRLEDDAVAVVLDWHPAAR